MFKYRGVNFIKTVYRPYPPLMSSMFYVGYNNQKLWKEFIGFSYKVKNIIQIEGIYYFSPEHLTKFVEKETRHILKDKQNFLLLKKATLAKERAILSTIRNNNQKDFTSFFKKYLDYQPALSLYHICDDFIEERLRKELNKKISIKETDEIMSHLNLPLELNIDQKIKRWFLKAGDIKEFIKEHSWNFSRYGKHIFLNPKEAASILSDLKKDKSLTGIDQSRAATKLAIQKAKKALGKKAYYVDVMQFFIYYRTHRTDILNKVFFSYYKRLSNFAASLGISYEDLIHCSYGEIVNKKIPNSKVLAERKKEFVSYLDNGIVKIVSGKQVGYFKMLSSEKKFKGVITGRTAFPGIISGRVKIISNPQDLKDFKQGNILVTSMTTPSMVMAMKKAIAFVTDEGGITCHAAILAREMKKPCVIGTKNATKVLHDGDLIEVGANMGIVKIIKRK